MKKGKRERGRLLHRGVGQGQHGITRCQQLSQTPSGMWHVCVCTCEDMHVPISAENACLDAWGTSVQGCVCVSSPSCPMLASLAGSVCRLDHPIPALSAWALLCAWPPAPLRPQGLAPLGRCGRRGPGDGHLHLGRLQPVPRTSRWSWSLQAEKEGRAGRDQVVARSLHHHCYGTDYKTISA